MPLVRPIRGISLTLRVHYICTWSQIQGQVAVMNDDELIAHYIELNPHHPGLDEARLKNRGVAVWALIGYLHGGAEGSIARVAVDYDLPREAVEAAIAYYRRY